MNNEEEVAQKLSEVVANGTEEEARAFIIEHLREFPEDMQRALVLDIFEETLEEQVAQQELLVELRKEAADVINATENK